VECLHESVQCSDAPRIGGCCLSDAVVHGQRR
jgi:hypothetical protein